MGNCRSSANSCARAGYNTFFVKVSAGFTGLVFVLSAAVAAVTVPLLLYFKKDAGALQDKSGKKEV